MTDSRDDYWEDILDSVDMDVLPLEYINTVVVKFVDGKVWDIDINRSKDRTTDIENTLDDFFEEYEDRIDTVDFRLDTPRLKKDVSRRTARFLKMNK